MTKERLVSRYKAKYPSLAEHDDDRLFSALLKKYPEYQEQLDNPYITQSTDMLNKLPDVFKSAYNQSITGLAEEMSTGKKRFDLSNYQPGIVEDIGAGLLSFLMPADLVTTVAGGGIGGAATKSMATKFITKKLVQNGVNGGVARSVAKKTAKTLGQSTAGIATYEGFKSAFTQKLETGDIKPDEVIKDTMSGALLGGSMAGTGAYLTTKGYSTLTRVLAETGVLGTTLPLSEGEIPEPQDYVNAAGMMLGIKAVGGALGSPRKLMELKKDFKKARGTGYKQELVEEDLAKEFGVAVGKLDDVARRQSEVYIDNSGSKWNIISPEGRKKIKLVNYNTGESKIVKDTDFSLQYRLEDEVQVPITKLMDLRRNNLRKLEKSQGVDNSLKQTLRNSSMQKSKSKTLSQIDPNKDKIGLDDMTGVELDRYRNALLKRKSVNEAVDKLQNKGWVTQEAKYSIFKEDFFPKPIKSMIEGLTRAKYRGSQKAPVRKFFNDVGQYQTDRESLNGEYLGRLMQTGLFKPTKQQLSRFRTGGLNKEQAEEAYYENLYELLKQGKLPEINSITSLIAQRFTSTGGQMPGFQQNYAPGMMKKDLADIIFDDMLKALDKKSEIARALKADFNYTDNDFILSMVSNPDKWIKKNPELSNYLDKLIRKSMSKFSKETKILLDANVESGSNLQYLRAYQRVGNGLSEELFNTFGNLEKPKKFKIPEELLEKNLKTLLSRYATKAANRTAFIKNFGSKGEKYKALLQKAEPDDEYIMRTLHHHVKGDIEYHNSYNYRPSTKKFWQKVAEWETSTKIGLGYAPLLNVTQPTISTALEAGYLPFFRGLISLNDKKVRDLIERSGVTNYSMFAEMMGHTQSSSLSSKVTNALGKYSGFNGINKVNQITAASTAKVLVDDMFKIVKGRGVRGRIKASRGWASNKLQKLGIDPNKSRLTDKDYITAMARFARKTQLQKDILEDPLLFNDPRARVFTQFKRFGLRQTNYLKDLFISDISRGNFMPLLRLGIAGFAGGTITLKSKAFLKGLLSGERVYSPDEKIPEDLMDIVENISAIGAFGFMGDIISSSIEEGKSYSGSLRFLAYPPFVSDVDNLFTKFIPAMEKDFDVFREDAFARMPTRLLRLTGSSFLREGSKLIETEGFKLDRIKSTRTRTIDKILRMLEKSREEKDYAKAKEEVSAWNKSHPQFPILMSDINVKKLLQRKMRRYKKKALG